MPGGDSFSRGSRGPASAAGVAGGLAAGLLALLTGLALPAFLLLDDVEGVAYHLAVYRESFVATGAPAATGFDADQLVSVVTRVLDYATGRRADLQFDRAALDGGPPGRPAFSQSELDHMVDVRALFGLGRRVRAASLAAIFGGVALVLALDRRRAGRRLAGGLLAGSALSLLASAILAAAVLVAFGRFWDAFHLSLFTNDLWQLPEDSLLIRMLPESLFRRLVLEIVGLLSVEVLLVVGVSGLYLRRTAARPGDGPGRGRAGPGGAEPAPDGAGGERP